MKKLFISLVILIVMLISVTVNAAAPEQIYLDDEGNSNDLVVLSDFTEDNNSITKFDNILSGSGQDGVIVTLYVKDSETEVYHKIKIKQADVNSENTYDNEEEKTQKEDLSFVIGASGLFMQEIELNNGDNYLALYAEKGSNNQIIKININKLNEDYKSFLERITVNITNELKKLIGPKDQ